MDRSNRLAIDDICDTLVEVRDRASREGYGLLVHLIMKRSKKQKTSSRL
jgi:hypothetical protein